MDLKLTWHTPALPLPPPFGRSARAMYPIIYYFMKNAVNVLVCVCIPGVPNTRPAGPKTGLQL